MHIPDGYLSPETCAATAALAVPALAVAARRVDRVARTRQVPLLAMFSAASFLVMMFNVPVPGGTTAHAVGAAFIAIVLGPSAAMIAVTVALTFQALLFGDGGVLALGANVLNLAVAMPLAAWGTYRLVAGRAALASRRRLVAAFLGGYVGITVAALATAVEVGLQPLLFADAAGNPLYAPYPLAITVPAMVIPHLLVAGPLEGVLTAGVLSHLVRADPEVLAATRAPADEPAHEPADEPARIRPASVALPVVAALAVLSPLGLLAPGSAFGEDSPEDLDLVSLGLSAIPEGLQRYHDWWSHAVLADYGLGPGVDPVLGYLVSAGVGIVVVGFAVYVLALCADGLLRRRPAA